MIVQTHVGVYGNAFLKWKASHVWKVLPYMRRLTPQTTGSQSLRLMRCTRHSIRRQDGAMQQTLNSKAGNVRCIRQSQLSTRWCDAPETEFEDNMVRCTILFQFATTCCDAPDSHFSTVVRCTVQSHLEDYSRQAGAMHQTVPIQSTRE